MYDLLLFCKKGLLRFYNEMQKLCEIHLSLGILLWQSVDNHSLPHPSILRHVCPHAQALRKILHKVQLANQSFGLEIQNKHQRRIPKNSRLGLSIKNGLLKYKLQITIISKAEMSLTRTHVNILKLGNKGPTEQESLNRHRISLLWRHLFDSSIPRVQKLHRVLGRAQHCTANPITLHLTQGLPLPFLPSILPVTARCSSPSFLVRSPKDSICLVLVPFSHPLYTLVFSVPPRCLHVPSMIFSSTFLETTFLGLALCLPISLQCSNIRFRRSVQDRYSTAEF